MLIDAIKTGDRVEIAYEYMPSNAKPFVSRVESVVKKLTVVIHAPMAAGAVVRLPTDKKYILRFITEKGIYRFRAVISGYSNDDGFPMVLFKMRDEGTRVQMRNFFRVTCSIPFTFSVVAESDTDAPPEKHDGLIRDLGGGGMKMISKLNMDDWEIITGVLPVGDERLLVFGEIRHKVHTFGALIPYQYGIKFVSLPKMDQEMLVQYLTNEQLKIFQHAR